MEKRNNQFIITTVCLLIVLVLSSCLAVCLCGMTACAATTDDEPTAEPKGLMTQMSISIGVDMDNLEVFAKAHNDFTLGFSTIQVYCELYSSLDSQNSCSNMKLEAIKYIGDLNIGKTLTTTAKINGVKRYWRARMRYKFDNKSWVSKETETVLIEADGMWLG